MKLFNIHNTEKFYKTIDSCKKPVLVASSDGRTEDFRNNTLIREVLENSANGSIPEIELHTSCAEDSRKLLDYMVYGYNFSDLAKKSA